jgi:CRP-like cAMP-binding protein
MTDPNSNRFLKCLSLQAREQILEHATWIDLPMRRTFYRAEERMDHAVFILAGLASVVSTSEDGETAEVGIIGSEGFVGSMHLLGPAVISTSSFMQMPGTGIEVPFKELRKLFLSSEEIRSRVLEFAQEQMLTVSHVAACNCLHDVEARLARWLLMAEDRTGSNILTFTQEFLGMMLGARRTTVTLVAGTLQRVGLIEYSRGRVTLIDREKLEEAACDCYQITKHLQANLYSKDWRNDVSAANSATKLQSAN